MVKRGWSDILGEDGCILGEYGCMVFQRDLKDDCQQHKGNLWLLGEYDSGSLTSKRQPVVKDLVQNKDLTLLLLKAYPRAKMVDRIFVNVMRHLIAEDPSTKTYGSFDLDIFLSRLTKRVHIQFPHLRDCKTDRSLVELRCETAATSFASTTSSVPSAARTPWR